MNFVKANGDKDTHKKVGACFVWLFITVIFGISIGYIISKFKNTDFDTKLAISFGISAYSLAIILMCSIKNIKMGGLEVESSKTDNNSDKNYKVFYYGVAPYIANRLGLPYPNLEKLHSCKEYHLCEIKTYETLANRRLWNIFCPFIETETLTEEETDDIFIYSSTQSSK